jgi:hypothetical protein
MLIMETHVSTWPLSMADHLRSRSLSVSSTLTLGSTYEEIFGCHAETSELIKDAEQMIRRNVAGTFVRNSLKRELLTNVKADTFLQAMLKYAIGDSGKRYTACTILATKNGDHSLQEVASTWLYDLVYPGKLCNF